jgi:UDP-N-acetyl-D-mannosaminuronate dehydrogenase
LKFNSVKFVNTIKGKYDAVIAAVAHNQFKGRNFRNNLSRHLEKTSVIYDLKNIFSNDLADLRL